MFDFLAGLAIGVIFAPFWMMVWNTLIKPLISKVLSSKTPPAPPAK